MDSILIDDDDDDIQLIKVEPKKKGLSWVSSSFGDFDIASGQRQKSLSVSKVSSNSQTRNQRTKTAASASQSLISAFASESQSRKRPWRLMHKISSEMQTQTKTPTKASLSGDLWSQKYQPVLRGDLAMHKKKVEEIADWLRLKSSCVSKRAAPILLLTGPPGAGKTVCIHVLCNDLGLDVREWSSSQELSAPQWSSEDFIRSEVSKVDVYTSQSQSSGFQNFLLRANKYQPLDLFSSLENNSKNNSAIATDKNRNYHNKRESNSVIVVEDMPNIFFRDTIQFHDILRKYRHHGHCPLVFIMSESNTNSSSIQKLFPKDLQQQLNISNISVNPVAPTMLIKALNRVVSQEVVHSKFNPPNVSVIESIAMSSNGDVRSALNTLQFACRTDTTDLKDLCKSSSKSLMKKQSSRLKYGQSKKTECENSQVDDSSGTIGVKDKTMFLFHALGKILYFKRGDPKDYPDHPTLPGHMKEWDRDPLLLDPEEVASQSHLSGDYFNSFLHENYVEFLSSVEDLERASEYFSDSDYFSSLWMAREELKNFSVSIATRGFIHSNSDICQHNSLRKNHGWRPLHKSQWFNVRKQADENITSARQIFKGYHWEPDVLCTEIIPYISLTNPTLRNTGQITFVQEMTQFSKSKQAYKSNAERLDEKDLGEDDEEEDNTDTSKSSDQKAVQFFSGTQMKTEEDENIDENNFVSSSQTKIQTTEEEDKDDFLIEDFDDEL